MLSPAWLSTFIGAAFALAENAIAAVSARSGEGKPRSRMSSFVSILIRPRESMPHLIEPSWAASLSSSGRRPGPGSATPSTHAVSKRFDARHIGSGVWGLWDGGVMSWGATDLSEDEAKQQAADMNVVYNQYGQREEKDRREVKPASPLTHLAGQQRGSSTTGSEIAPSGGGGCADRTVITYGSKLVIFGQPKRADDQAISPGPRFPPHQARTVCRLSPVAATPHDLVDH